MGTFSITIRAVGGHGCQRDATHGDIVHGCGLSGCPDCIAREFVKKLKDAGHSVTEATFTHWPGENASVVDNLLTGKRLGSF